MQMKYFSEETRKKMSESAKRRCTPEWRKRSSELHETRIDDNKMRELYESGMTQEEVAKELGVSRKVIFNHMRKHGVKARVAAKRNQSGPINHMWKGDNASYKAFHVRLKHEKGKAKDHGCAVCGTKDPSIWYDWANLTGKFEDMDDYLPMCRSCHRKYDKKRRKQDGEAS